jgi:hypothetical protein
MATATPSNDLRSRSLYLVRANDVPAVSLIADQLLRDGALWTSDADDARRHNHGLEGFVIGAAIPADASDEAAWEALTTTRETFLSAIQLCRPTANGLLIVTDTRRKPFGRALTMWTSSVVQDVEIEAGQHALSLTLNAVHLYADANDAAFAHSAAGILSKKKFIVTGETITIDHSSSDVLEALVAAAL